MLNSPPPPPPPPFFLPFLLPSPSSPKSPTQECYGLLQKHQITVQQEDVDRVDTMRYLWQNVRHQCVQVQDHLTEVQTSFKSSLLTSSAVYKKDVATFVEDYAEVKGLGTRQVGEGCTLHVRGLGTRQVGEGGGDALLM